MSIQPQAIDVETHAKLEAIHRVMAVIEFKMDGPILHANENFLSVMGYSLPEVRGQHHRMFVEPEFARSADDSDFRANLNRGEFNAAKFKRIRKGGREVLIQASYTPIEDANGRTTKVVEFATDVTDQVRRSQAIESFIDEASSVLGCMAGGNLTGRVQGSYGDDLDVVKKSINEVVENMSDALGAIIDNAPPLASSSEELSARSKQMSTRSLRHRS